jgi:tetratricopeptide (TPR) repeat protein
MSAGHCFISYSNAESEPATTGFAFKLADKLKAGPPSIDIWIDNRSMNPGENWDKQVSNAIKSCKCFLFIVSPDSVSDNCICCDEWDFALRYKKPVIPLLLYKGVEVPFRLGRRKFIDFTGDFETKLSELRNLIAWLDSPEGVLQALKDRLADAQRDLRRSPENKQRIEKEIEELNALIQSQEKIVRNPKATQEQTQKNIEAGLERERKPEKPIATKTETKFINPPPGIAPTWYQDRYVEEEEVVKFLKDDAQRLITIVGRGGVGKTAMVCRLLKGLESGELPDGLGAMKVEGIVYLSESGSHRVNFANIFYDLCKLLPNDASNELDAVYKNPQGSTESKMTAVLEKFTGGRVALLLDNFEPLVDTETFELRDKELDEALRAFLNGTHTAVNIVITTRVAPRALNLTQPGRQRVLTLDEGLESPYAENILREMDSDGRMGLKSAPADLLRRARERTRGYPRALEAMFAILASDRYTTLEELLTMPTPENVVEALVGEAFNRLDTNAQKVMQALAVYNRPVTPAAVDYLLAPHIPAIDSAPILQRLANMHFARKESGRFYLHPVDREFAFGLIPEKDLTTENKESTEDFEEEDNYQLPFTQQALTRRAADYFKQARKPRAEWKKLDDLSAQLAEFDLRCAAGDYDTAADVLTDIDFDYLLLWGHYRLMIDLHERLQGKVVDKELTRISANNLGAANSSIGKVNIAIQQYQRLLELARQENAKQHEGAALGNLGGAYAALGDARKAIEFYEQALVIAREIGDRKGEGNRLGNLGGTYADLGDARKAIEFYEQALVFAREIGDRKGEGNRLGNLGGTYADLGDARKAIEFYEQALVIFREIGDRHGEGINLGRLGIAYDSFGESYKALEYFEQTLEIAREIGDKRTEGVYLGNIAEERINLGEYDLAIQATQQYIKICEEIDKPGSYAFRRLAEAYLHKSELSKARESVNAAQKYDEPQNNHNISTLIGIIALRRGDEVTARGAFLRAIGQADEILSKTAEYYSALDAKGLALCGLVLVKDLTGFTESLPNEKRADENLSGLIEQAIETFRKARVIAPHAGVVKSVLRLFDELVKCDEKNVLNDVRAVIEGNVER